MSDESQEEEMVTVNSTRFGEFTVPASTVIELPSGMIGFPSYTKYVMLEHKAPFCWLQSLDTPDLAFVVVDGFEFGDNYKVKPPFGDSECGFREDGEYAILVIVTVRPDPKDTTANLKAPVFVNLENRRGVQVIFDSSAFSTRFPLWAGADGEEGEESSESADTSQVNEPEPEE